MNANHTLLITGGTGSFGKAFLKNILALPQESVPKRIIVFSRDEDKQFHQRQLLPDPRIEYFVGDIRDLDTLKKATKGVDTIIHAAALKQVPTGEFFPNEVVRTNVLGSHNVIEAAIANNVRKVVAISTDKAVAPLNAYGMSKAIAEKYFYAASADRNNQTKFVMVRYGNVMGSRGSVIPLFIKQIQEGLPLTITDGSMTRFLLKLDEAVGLVHHAILYGDTGELFIKKAPACTVDSLIQALELHYGKTLEKKIIGIRPGEKLHEVLLNEDEVGRGSEVSSIEGGNLFKVSSIFNQGIVLSPEQLATFEKIQPKSLSALASNTTRMLDAKETLELIRGEKLL